MPTAMTGISGFTLDGVDYSVPGTTCTGAVPGTACLYHSRALNKDEPPGLITQMPRATNIYRCM